MQYHNYPWGKVVREIHYEDGGESMELHPGRLVRGGRPILWGLAVRGQEGVKHTLELLHAELTSAMV